jgi:type I restriction enzyme, S subunit
MTNHNITAESNNFIMLDKYNKQSRIREGLPCEITLRQKQYEYYHDLLLSFPKTKEEQ